MSRIAVIVMMLVGGAASDALAQTAAPLQVVVTPKQRVMAVKELAFRIVLRNVSNEPLLLNGGGILGNGRHAWSIECTVQPAQGRPVRLGLHWQMGGVAGRVYPLTVALGPGDSHAIEVTPDDYFQASALPTGSLTLQCRFTGRPTDPVEWPTTWTGNAVSAPVRVELTAPPSPR